MRKYKLHILFGLLLIFIGLIMSSTDLINFLRTSSGAISEELLLGAKLFKIGLVIIGISIILLGSMPIWRLSPASGEKLNKTDRKSNSIFLIIILFAASALRIYGLNEGLWIDEILTLVNYVKGPFGEMVTSYDSQNQHFLYSILAHTSFQLFGESIWSLRLPAVLFGVASIWALYLLGRQVVSTRETLLSATLFAFSYHHIWFSQNARGYTGLLFFTIMTSWLFIRGLEDGRPGLWIVYAIFAALGAYIHISMVFVVTGHFIVFIINLITKRNEPRQTKWIPLIGFYLAALFTYQLYSLVLPQMFGGVIGHGNVVATWKNPVWALMELYKGIKINLRGIVPIVLALCIFISGFWNFVRKNLIFIGLFCIPVIIVATITIAMGHHIWPRLFFFSFGFGVLIITRGTMEFVHFVGRLLKIGPQKLMNLGTAVFALIILAFALSAPRAYGPKQDYLSALTFIESNKDHNDIVLTIGSTTFVYKEYFNLDWTGLEDQESFDMIRANQNVIWIVYTFPFYIESEYPEVMDLIRRDFSTVKRFDGTLNGGTIFVCRSEISLS